MHEKNEQIVFAIVEELGRKLPWAIAKGIVIAWALIFAGMAALGALVALAEVVYPS